MNAVSGQWTALLPSKKKKKKTGLSIVLECEAITFLCDNVHIILRKFYEITWKLSCGNHQRISRHLILTEQILNCQYSGAALLATAFIEQPLVLAFIFCSNSKLFCPDVPQISTLFVCLQLINTLQWCFVSSVCRILSLPSLEATEREWLRNGTVSF